MSLISKLTARIAALRPTFTPPVAPPVQTPSAPPAAFAPYAGESSFDESPALSDEELIPFVESADVPPELEELDADAPAEWDVSELPADPASDAPFIFLAPLTGEGVGEQFVDSEDLASERAEIVQRAYLDVLGREPDAGGFASWTDRALALQTVGATPAQIAAEIEAGLKNSEEYAQRPVSQPAAALVDSSEAAAGREALVRSAYLAFLGREPDVGGLKGWVEHVKKVQESGAGAKEVSASLEAAFTGSEEYLRRQSTPQPVKASAHELMAAVRKLKSSQQISA